MLTIIRLAQANIIKTDYNSSLPCLKAHLLTFFFHDVSLDGLQAPSTLRTASYHVLRDNNVHNRHRHAVKSCVYTKASPNEQKAIDPSHFFFRSRVNGRKNRT